jgi:hypothetical protein
VMRRAPSRSNSVEAFAAMRAPSRSNSQSILRRTPDANSSGGAFDDVVEFVPMEVGHVNIAAEPQPLANSTILPADPQSLPMNDDITMTAERQHYDLSSVVGQVMNQHHSADNQAAGVAANDTLDVVSPRSSKSGTKFHHSLLDDAKSDSRAITTRDLNASTPGTSFYDRELSVFVSRGTSQEQFRGCS